MAVHLLHTVGRSLTLEAVSLHDTSSTAALTRANDVDVINPVKRSVEGLTDVIREYERQEMETKIYTLIPPSWLPEMRMFTESEYSTVRSKENTLVRDGELVKAVDDLAAFIEAYLAVRNGIQNQDLHEAMHNVRTRYWAKNYAGIDFSQLYEEFS